MQNHWLNNAKIKQLLSDIDKIAMDTWASDGTLGDFFASLNDEETDLLFAMRIKNFSSDIDEMVCSFDLETV